MSRFFSASRLASPQSLLHRGDDPVPGGSATQIKVSALINLRTLAMGLSLEPAHIRSERSGSYLSSYKGRGVEFAESRPYQAGDEVRYMDWRVTARTGKPHSKVFHEDRERAILVWVDLRRAMFFATRGTFKAVLAARAAALVAWGAALQGDRLGGLLFAEDCHREIRPFHGDRAVSRLVGLMAEFTPQNSPVIAEAQSTKNINTLEESLLRLRRVTRPGSHLFLFSDFIQLGEREKIQVAQLAQHNDVAMMFFYDRLEQALPPPGWYPFCKENKFLDVTHSAFYALNCDSAAQRRTYRNNFQDRYDDLNKFCRHHGILFVPCSTEENSVTQLQRHFGRRSRVGRGKG